MQWKETLYIARDIMQNQHGDLYDSDFEEAIRHISTLDSGEISQFDTGEWKDFGKWLDNMAQLIYYVARADVKKDFDEIKRFSERLLSYWV